MLRAALTTVHSDPRWWQTVLLGGALMLTLLGYPLASGLVMESIENSRNGYPTPLPPWRGDLGTRYLMGLFALVIDFFFFGMPGLISILLLFCLSLGTATISGNNGQLLLLAFVLPAVLWFFCSLLLFLSSISPVARMVSAQQGSLEDALSFKPLRYALHPASAVCSGVRGLPHCPFIFRCCCSARCCCGCCNSHSLAVRCLYCC